MTEITKSTEENKDDNRASELKIKPQFIYIAEKAEKRKEIVIEDENDSKRIKVEYEVKKGKRSRKDVGLEKDTGDLCRAVAQGNECINKLCTRLHDVKKYLETKPKDLGDVCHIFEVTGFCPDGFNCRFGDSHINREIPSLVFKPEEERTPLVGESNAQMFDTISSIRKGTYEFDDYTKPIGSLGDLEIKPVDFKQKVYIAPLTTTGNLPFRRICVDFGADITTGEMAVSYNLLKGQSSEWALLKRHPSEKVFGVQIAGSNGKVMKDIGDIIRKKLDVDFVDLNAGCPIDAINKTGCGAALLQRKNHMKEVVENFLTGLKTVPLVLKTRIAWDKTPILHTWIPDIQTWSGQYGNRISCLCIHGRTRAQRYSKLADWDYISQCIKAQSEEQPLTIIGNGDIYNFTEWYDHIDKGIPGSMIGRGALIKPWIGTEIKERRQWDISSSERFDILKNYVNYGLEHWGSDQKGVNNTRRFLLEWMSFLCRYVPVGLLEQPTQILNQRIPRYIGRNDMETLLGSDQVEDWIKISEMLLGPVPDHYRFLPKHKSSAYSAEIK